MQDVVTLRSQYHSRTQNIFGREKNTREAREGRLEDRGVKLYKIR